MGFDCGNLVLLAEYVRRAPLGSVLTYGRLFNTLTLRDRRKIMRSHGLPESALAARESEALFSALNASRVTSLDIADHDGSDLLADDGVYIFDLPVSGWLSHGVYQFTPSYFLSVGASPYFDLTHYFFHRKHCDRIYRIAHYNGFSYFRINGRRRVSAWGVLRKVRPEGDDKPLTLDRFRVMQVDPRAECAGQTILGGQARQRRELLRQHHPPGFRLTPHRLVD